MIDKIITRAGYIIIGIALLATLAFEVKLIIENIPSNFDLLFFIGFLGFNLFSICWDIAPYILMVYSLKWFSSSTSRMRILNCIAIFFVSSVGLYLMASTLFISRDPQAPIALFFIPILQIAAYGILALTFSCIEWVFRNIY